MDFFCYKLCVKSLILFLFVFVDMVRDRWPCHGSSSRGSRSRGRGSSSGKSYKLVDEADNTLMDGHAPTAPLGDDVNPVAWHNRDGNETPASRQKS